MRLVRHPLFARVYARLAPAMDRAGLADRRRRLLTGLTGRVVEIGSGSGLNFAHYPAEVAGVLAVEPEPSLLRYAVRNAARAPVPVALVDGTAEHVPGADAAFDAAVVCLVLCSVPDQRAALAELHRVIRPGGQLRFLDTSAPTAAGCAACSASSTRRCGRRWSVAVTCPATPSPASRRPASP